MLASKEGRVTLLAEGVNLARAFTEEGCLGHLCCVYVCVCVHACVCVSDQRFLFPQICRPWYSDLCLVLEKHIYAQIKYFYRSTIYAQPHWWCLGGASIWLHITVDREIFAVRNFRAKKFRVKIFSLSGPTTKI